LGLRSVCLYNVLHPSVGFSSLGLQKLLTNVCGLYHDAARVSNCTAQWFMNDELNIIWKGWGHDLSEVRWENFPGMTEEYYEKPQVHITDVRPTFKPGTSQINF
jgi:hypothetical protein